LNHFTIATISLKGVWDAPLVNQYVTDSIGIFARSKDTLGIVNFISSRFPFPRETGFSNRIYLLRCLSIAFSNQWKKNCNKIN